MAIKELGYVIVETARLREWHGFLTCVVGAMPVGKAVDDAAHYRLDDRPFRFRIVEGQSERLRAAAYEIDSRAALDALAARVAEAGRPVEWGTAQDAAVRGVAGYFCTSDPAGNGLEFYAGDTRDSTPFVSPQGVPAFVTGSMGMGHAVFSAPNFTQTHRFYRDVVGFHDTDLPAFHLMGPDAPPMHFAFMHADNGRHHSVALGEGPVPPSGCVHLMVQLPNLLEVGKAHDRMKAAGCTESATLGQHWNDETVGFYVQTPGGFDLEIGCDSLVIDPATWNVTRHEGISIWGHEWAWQRAVSQAQATEAAE